MFKSKIVSLLGMTAAMSLVAVAFVQADGVAPVVDINNDHVQLAANTNNQQPATVTDVSDNDADDASANSRNNPAASPAPANAMMDPSMPVDQRVNQLAKQVQNITTMNLPEQISDLQNQIQQLRGQLQVQSHDLQLLNTQQRSFYQDVDQRIQQLKVLINNNGSSSTPASSTPAAKTKKTPAVGSVTSQLNANDAAEKFNLKDAQTYQAAFAQVLKKKFTDAMEGLQNYLSSYPNGRYAVNAHYWLGEIYLRQSQSKKAIQEFSTVVKNYPKSNKVADSKLKIAMIHMSQGKKDQAKTEYQALKKQYPGTTAAQLASIQLQQLAAGGDANHVQ